MGGLVIKRVGNDVAVFSPGKMALIIFCRHVSLLAEPRSRHGLRTMSPRTLTAWQVESSVSCFLGRRISIAHPAPYFEG